MVAPKAVFKDGMINQAQSHYNFLALNVLFSQLNTDRKYTILDMGPASGANINFFSHYHCKIFIEDFYRVRVENTSKKDNPSSASLLQDYGDGTKFDIILFWDLFDYVEPDDLKDLIRHLSKYCTKGSMLFFVTSGMEFIPNQPASFKIIDKNNLVYENHAPTTRKSHGYRQSVYRQLLPGFSLYRGFRMSSGMEENLFKFD
ncbi:MAG: methyltransferase domain-containing protein [Gammaproteobacteria bacterium]|nr:methyltransferase domain-containing protein [Gammaproteobacteria bacterium]